MMCFGKVIIPEWISCHTYFFGEDKSRTYIANEKNHTYVQLDGISSDLWKLIFDKVDNETLNVFIKKHDIEEQIDDFLESLAEQELISILDSSISKEATYQPLFCADEYYDEEKRFVEEMQTWLFENNFMFSIFFELTYRCNLKCVHCYNPKHMNNVELDFELAKKAIDDAYELGCFRVTFSGGESTLYSRFLEIVKYAREKHMSVEIFTNGQMFSLNESLYNEIKSMYPYRVCVSLYSTDEKTHDKVTDIKGSFAKTYSLIDRMKKENLNVQIKNFLLNFNCMDCIKVKKLAKETGATSVADISLIPTIEGDKKTLQFALSDEDLFSLYTIEDSPLYITEDFKPMNMDNIKEQTPCLGGITGLCISPGAEVVICVSMPFSVGNLNSTSLKKIWDDAYLRKNDSLLAKWRDVRISDCTECYKEDYCAFCNYCPGMGYLENGYLKHSDVQCKQAKNKMKAYNYLKEIREHNVLSTEH